MESTTPGGKKEFIVGALHPHWVGDHSQCPNPARCEAGGLLYDSWQDGHFTPEAVAESTRLATAATAKIELDKALNPRAGERICIAYPHLDSFGANFVDSVLRVAAYDKDHGDYLLHNSGLLNQGSLCATWGRSVELAHARNTATAAFLSSDSDWLLWWDTDIGVQQDAVEKLMEVADPIERPIVGGLCFVEGDYSHDMHGGLRSSLAPTMYDWTWVEPKSGMPGAYKLLNRQEWLPEQPVRVAATGCGFLLIHRSVFEDISAWLIESGAPGHIWFERIPGPDGELSGEDISFCMRANQVGKPVFVHTGITTTHQKTVWYGVPEYHQKPFTPPPMTLIPLPPEQWPKLMVNRDAARQAEEQSPTRQKQVPEAPEKVAIIVPVAKRDNALPFLESLKDSISEEQRERIVVYVMADAEDFATHEAWMKWHGFPYPIQQVDAHHYLREMGSFAEKVNRGFEISDEPWLFLVGDDVHFHKGWLDQALEVARTTGARVVGTNDLGNPAVLAGEHATHMLISREYVEKVGASWDGPGIVCHEGYRHWFVDDEVVAAAKQRGTWQMALGSIVEHLHPLFGRGEDDAVYRLGQSFADEDRKVFEARCQTYL